MPNWCENSVRVSGEYKELLRFIDFVKSEEEHFSFQAINPMPEELHWVQSPVSIKTQEEIDAYKEEHKDSEYMMRSFPITKEMHSYYIQKYGCATWYDWANDMWGTKWDARDVKLENLFDGVEEVVYRFDTAWGPPEPIYHTLAKEFPDLHISWYFNEPGMEFAGYLHEGVNFI